MFHNTGSHPGPPSRHNQHALHRQSSPHRTLGSRRPLQKTPRKFFFYACTRYIQKQQRTKVLKQKWHWQQQQQLPDAGLTFLKDDRSGFKKIFQKTSHLSKLVGCRRILFLWGCKQHLPSPALLYSCHGEVHSSRRLHQQVSSCQVAVDRPSSPIWWSSRGCSRSKSSCPL